MPDDAGFSLVDSIPAEFSDENLTLRFTAEHAASLRYVYGWDAGMSGTVRCGVLTRR